MANGSRRDVADDALIPVVVRLPLAPASSFAHALYIFLGVVAVAVAVAEGRGKKPLLSPTLSHSAEMPISRAASEIL